MARFINTVYWLRVTLGFCAVVHLLIALIQTPEYNITLEDYVRDLSRSGLYILLLVGPVFVFLRWRRRETLGAFLTGGTLAGMASGLVFYLDQFPAGPPDYESGWVEPPFTVPWPAFMMMGAVFGFLATVLFWITVYWPRVPRG